MLGIFDTCDLRSRRVESEDALYSSNKRCLHEGLHTDGGRIEIDVRCIARRSVGEDNPKLLKQYFAYPIKMRDICGEIKVAMK